MMSEERSATEHRPEITAVAAAPKRNLRTGTNHLDQLGRQTTWPRATRYTGVSRAR